MKKDNTIYLLKLGGSLITDKSKPLSLREDVINRTIEQIIESNKSIVLIHGGGSFGHPIAKKYQLSKGLNTSIKNQVFGLSKTHEMMNQLNTIIINKFLKKDYPVLSISPSTIFTKRSQQFVLSSIDPIENSLKLGILPILYGDIILEKDGSFSIISGDDIILELCKTLKNFEVAKVIFAIEKDGIYVKDGINIELASEINFDDLKSIKLAELEHKIDVTGGIGRKFEIIKQIAELNIPVQVINGLKKDYILKSLKNQKIVSTNISLSKENDTQAIHTRKLEHLTIPLDYNVQSTKNYFDEIILIHHPLPDIELHDVELETNFFNKSISAPICIAAITGGHPISKKINKILAQAAESENIIMSVGSQRIALENQSTVDSFQIVREYAPNIPIIGNLGIGQISSNNFQLEEFQKCIEMINADIMAIHFNALHELVQKNGNIYYTSFYNNFKLIREKFNIPIIAKEVGSGFNRDLALQLDLLGFDGFDVGGMGGTNFTSIESIRNNNNNENYTRKLADTLKNWGIPTPISILNVRSTSKKPIIATGGLRTGLDIAKSIVLGADIGGFAYKFLKSAWKDYKQETITNTINEIRTLKHELRSAMWLININTIENLKGKREKSVLLGDLYKWANQ
ncbi:MAG: type 2 isopentenyl-diphosphate Delta-isomerase [Candidatus Odinarchaeota archaeon]